MSKQDKKQGQQPANASKPEVKTDAPVAAEVVTVKGIKIEFSLSQADEQIKKHGNISNAIRALKELGLTTGQISKVLGKRYQHVRNVLSQPLKRVIKAERDAKTVTATDGNSVDQKAPVAVAA